MRRWYESYPERLTFELEEFERCGLGFTLDEEHLARTGLVLLAGTVDIDGEQVNLQLLYPDSFPFMRPEVFAPDLSLERHQNPYERNLCLLERSTRAWSVDETGAWLVSVRVPQLLRLLAQGGEALRAAEVPQGEPASVYFAGEPGAVVFLPGAMLHVEPEHRVGLMQLATGANEPPQQLLRACLSKLSVRAHGGKKQVVARFGSPLSERFSGRTIEGRWARIERLPDGRLPRDLLAAIVAVEPTLEKPRWQRLPDGNKISILGAVVQEEVLQGEWQDSWIFLVTIEDSPKQQRRYITHAERLTAEDLRVRLPERLSMDEHTLAIVGLGSLGAPISAELLRAQVGELRVLDFDRVEAGNIVRWTHGLSAVGYAKTQVIAGWAAGEFPFSRVVPTNMRLGAVPAPDEQLPSGAPSEAQALGEFLDGVDLVIDATGELGVQHLLSVVSAERELAQVYAWSTEGGWGGAVAVLGSGEGAGCWMCLQLAFEDGTIPLPPSAPDPPCEPRGCGDTTFAAAAFELTPIVAQCVRSAARLLAGEGAGEVHVCSLHGAEGELSAPRWETFAIPVHERCPCEHPIPVA
jgi:ThiF family